jgi:two-component system, cell cycle sensor histidine kinase and response regulator CckA
MDRLHKSGYFRTAREKLIGLSLESTRKSYYPQLQAQMARLKKAEERYRLLFENANDAIFISQDDRIKFPNPKTLEILGLDARQSESRPFSDFIHPEDREMGLTLLRRRVAGEIDLPATHDLRIISSTGKFYAVQISMVMITWEDRPAVLNIVRDVTGLKKLETDLRQAQKLEAIGTLAGGIAHDFNNILMGIQGRVSLMMADLDAGHLHYDHLKGIEEYVKSATSLTSQLLGFAKGGKYEIKPTDMNVLLEKSSEMFRRTRKEIRIIRNLDKNLWPVEVDRGQMNQVLLNLYVNAWQAMPKGGYLYLQTSNVDVGEGLAHSKEIRAGRYIKISIADTGEGIDDAIKSRIFDPFFTTKTMGRGTGLGLASAYGIIKNHGGTISVDSEVGHGSNFSIYLPASEEAVEKEPPAKAELINGDELIVLVDDEAMVLEVGRLMLVKLGYKVITADSGRMALDLIRDKQAGIALVILDMIMAGMSGGETFDRIKQIDPAVKVLLSSGYSINGQAIEILRRGCDGFIQKPFGLTDLSQKIREVLSKDKH